MKYLIMIMVVLAGINNLFSQDTIKMRPMPVINMNKALKRPPTIGLKIGYNIGISTINGGSAPNDKNGFMIGAYYGATGHGFMGYRSEIIFSRQGYTYSEPTKSTSVMNDYIYMPQLTTFSFGNFLQLQAGPQVGYLLGSKKSANGNADTSTVSLMNRIDYGFTAGIEIYPLKGLIIGARYNLGLGKAYKPYMQSGSTPVPFPLPFDPATTNLKNGGIHAFIGYRF